jgi:hypothetical protein
MPFDINAVTSSVTSAVTSLTQSQSPVSTWHPFARWADLALSPITGKAASDETRTKNFQQLIEFSKSLIKENKTVPDYMREETERGKEGGGAADWRMNLEDMLHGTFQLPRFQVLDLICELGIKQRGALYDMKEMLDENLKRSGRTPHSLFTQAEMEADDRNWENWTFSVVGHIDGDRLKKIRTETEVFIKNCANDRGLMIHLDKTDLSELSDDDRRDIVLRLEGHVNLANNSGSKIRYDDSGNNFGRTINTSGNCKILLNSSLEKSGLREIMRALSHEGFHASQYRETSPNKDRWGKTRPPLDHLIHGDAKSYEQVMLALSFSQPPSTGRDYRQGDEIEREGHVAMMVGSLYIAQNPRLDPKGTGFLSTIDFENDLDKKREQDPISIVRKVLEEKLDFCMGEFAEAARPTPTGRTFRIEVPDNAQVSPRTSAHSGIGTTDLQRRRDTRDVKQRIFDGLKHLNKHLDDDLRHSKISRIQIQDALEMGAPGLFYGKKLHSRLLQSTVDVAVRANSPENFMSGMREICEAACEDQDIPPGDMNRRLDDLQQRLTSPLAKYIVGQLKLP